MTILKNQLQERLQKMGVDQSFSWLNRKKY